MTPVLKCQIAEEEWKTHCAEAKTAMNRIALMNSEIQHISSSVEYLEKLGPINETLERLEKTLVDAATGRKQIPLFSHLIMIVFLGTALLIVIIEKSNRTIEIGTSGVKIGVPIADNKQHDR